MELEFFGAAREVTGSCHVLRVGGRTILLDCGLFQGHRAEAALKNARLPVPITAVDAVVLSHAHIDHAGRLPFLARLGYTGPVHATAATRDLSELMLADSAHIQESDAEFLHRHGKEAAEPLYTRADATALMKLMVGHPMEQPFDVVPGVRATLVEAGHILGSASVVLDCTERGTTRRLVFSGDIGRWGLPIIRDPKPPAGADAVIMESTYGNRDHPPEADMRGALARVVRETAARGGRVLIPAFAVGRTQEIIYDLHALAAAKEIPPIPIVVDSPLATDVTTVFDLHRELFDRAEETIERIREVFRFPALRYTRSVEESKALNSAAGPMIIIAASGMAESGRILHHLKNGADDPRNTILIVGFQAEHTLGRRIVERRPTLRILGDEVPLRAQVEVLNGYSAHADRTELRRWLETVRSGSPSLRQVWLVHGEPEAQDAFAETVRGLGLKVGCPRTGEKVAL